VVVDASVAVQWFSREPGSGIAERLMEAEFGLLAPDIMPVEAANAWWRKVRHGDMTRQDLEQAVVNLLALDILLASTVKLLTKATGLATALGHPVYDCVYLALSAERGASLATVDVRLRKTAARLGVGVWGAWPSS
jgi:predicted nucleic acid-binding protein